MQAAQVYTQRTHHAKKCVASRSLTLMGLICFSTRISLSTPLCRAGPPPAPCWLQFNPLVLSIAGVFHSACRCPTANGPYCASRMTSLIICIPWGLNLLTSQIGAAPQTSPSLHCLNRGCLRVARDYPMAASDRPRALFPILACLETKHIGTHFTFCFLVGLWPSSTTNLHLWPGE